MAFCFASFCATIRRVFCKSLINKNFLSSGRCFLTTECLPWILDRAVPEVPIRIREVVRSFFLPRPRPP